MLVEMTVDAVRRMGVVAGSAPLEGRALGLPGLLAPDATPRAAVVAALADSIAGVHAFEIESTALPLTADLAVHLTGRPVAPGAELAATSEVLKRRRTGAVFHVEVAEAGRPEVLVATSTVTYAYVEGVSPYRPEPIGEEAWPPPDLCDDLDALLSLEPVADGDIELEVDAVTSNAVGVLSGGAIVMALDVVTASRAASLLGRPVTTTDLAVHFLAPGRVGPARVATEVIARGPGRASLRHTLVDTGDDDRLIAVATSSAAAVDAGEEAA